MNAPSKFQDHITTVVDNPGRHIEKPIADRLEKLLFMDARKGQFFDPVDEIIGDHPDSEIGPVGMKLLAGKAVERKSVFGLPDEVLHGRPLQMKRDKLFGALLAVGDDDMIAQIDRLDKRQLLLLSVAISLSGPGNDRPSANGQADNATPRPRHSL